jgi:hypothetical protein
MLSRNVLSLVKIINSSTKRDLEYDRAASGCACEWVLAEIVSRDLLFCASGSQIERLPTRPSFY